MNEDKTRIEGLLLHRVFSWQRIVAGLSRVLRIDEAEIQDILQATEPPSLVAVEHYNREQGFQTDLTLYLRGDVGSDLADSVVLAERISSELQDEVLVSPPAYWPVSENPFLWILIQPNGKKFLVQQSDPDSDFVDINRDSRSMRRL